MFFSTHFRFSTLNFNGWLSTFTAFALAVIFASFLASAFTPGEALWLFLPAVLLAAYWKNSALAYIFLIGAICVVSYLFRHHIPYTLLSAFSLQIGWFSLLSVALIHLLAKLTRLKQPASTFDDDSKVLTTDSNGKVVTDVLEPSAAIDPQSDKQGQARGVISF